MALLFSENKEEHKIVIKKWKEGLQVEENETDELTFYFLDKPLKLSKILKKDGGTKKGRGKNWISAMIPSNRTVSFYDFLKRM